MSDAPINVDLSETVKSITKHTMRCSGLERKIQIGDSELATILQRVASNYKCSACVLALRRQAHMHVVATCNNGHRVFEKDIPLVHAEDFQLFHHHLRRPLPIIIDNAAADQRLKDDPFFVAHPRVRFYAAAPIYDSSQGYHGTLCIIDEKPKARFTLKEADFLCSCATVVANILQVQSRNREGREKENTSPIRKSFGTISKGPLNDQMTLPNSAQCSFSLELCDA
eukprot:TRINITY_DN4043_c0_g2_i1.p1 TRINITY_DN4043_c0_g2~~TRINITY_DN4043_c0_g2_i1.p1  ORF type:complete len:226 (-),score=22.98 TRINITY_DN4043_c0_g2_i1:130-807(-)